MVLLTDKEAFERMLISAGMKHREDPGVNGSVMLSVCRSQEKGTAMLTFDNKGNLVDVEGSDEG